MQSCYPRDLLLQIRAYYYYSSFIGNYLIGSCGHVCPLTCTTLLLFANYVGCTCFGIGFCLYSFRYMCGRMFSKSRFQIILYALLCYQPLCLSSVFNSTCTDGYIIIYYVYMMAGNLKLIRIASILYGVLWCEHQTAQPNLECIC